MTEESKASGDAKEYRKQDLDVKFGDSMNAVRDIYGGIMGAVQFKCEKFAADVSVLQIGVLNEASASIDEALEFGEDFVKQCESKGSGGNEKLKVAGRDLGRLNSLLDDIKASMEEGSPSKIVGKLDQVEGKVRSGCMRSERRGRREERRTN